MTIVEEENNVNLNNYDLVNNIININNPLEKKVENIFKNFSFSEKEISENQNYLFEMFGSFVNVCNGNIFFKNSSEKMHESLLDLPNPFHSIYFSGLIKYFYKKYNLLSFLYPKYFNFEREIEMQINYLTYCLKYDEEDIKLIGKNILK